MNWWQGIGTQFYTEKYVKQIIIKLLGEIFSRLGRASSNYLNYTCLPRGVW